MKRLVYLNARITVLLDDKVNHYCDRLNLTRSSFVLKSIMFFLKSKGYKVIEDSLMLQQQRELTKEDNHHLYLIKNAFMTIISICKMDLLLKGELNYDKINYMIRNYKRIYNYFPPRIKKLLKDDMRLLENLKYKNNLMQYMNNWDMVSEFIGSKKGSAKRIELK